MADEYDLLIVGGGLVGLTAALSGARIGLRTASSPLGTSATPHHAS